MPNVRDYKCVYYYSDDDECYLTELPEIPGCIADGQTISEAINNAYEFADIWMDIARESNIPILEPG